MLYSVTFFFKYKKIIFLTNIKKFFIYMLYRKSYTKQHNNKLSGNEKKRMHIVFHFFIKNKG